MAKTTSLVPWQLTKKPTATVKKKAPFPTPIKKPKTDNTLHNNSSDDSDNDDEAQTDFFSINKPVDIPLYEGPLDIDKLKEVTQNQKPKGIKSYFKKDVPNHVELQPDYEGYDNQGQYMDVSSNVANTYGIEAGSSYSGETAASSNNGDVVLDDEAVSITEQQAGRKIFSHTHVFASMILCKCKRFSTRQFQIRQLCGARGKRKREEIQIVDVNQQEVLADAREWLMKGLMDDTTKRVSSSKKKGNEPTSQQRRKHQITYLAHQVRIEILISCYGEFGH